MNDVEIEDVVSENEKVEELVETIEIALSVSNNLNVDYDYDDYD